MKTRFPFRLLAPLASVPVMAQVLATPVNSAQPTAVVAAPARFSVTVVGKGPDVILIPGLASSAHVWDATVAQLRTKYRVHIVQVAGFAGAPVRGNATGPIVTPFVAELARYIAAHKLRKPAVIGHSLGGLSALMLAADHGDALGKVMIVDALPWYGMVFGPTATMEGVLAQGAKMRDGLIGGGQAAYVAGVPKSMARLVKSTGPEAKAAIAAGEASDFNVTARAFYDVLATDMRPRLAGITTPVTMLYPWDETTGIPQAAFDALYTGAYAPLPNKTIRRIAGSYHFIQIDQPAAFAAEVEAFLMR
jgi:pimeloyl-ACP methyl ester carboxylesterase